MLIREATAQDKNEWNDIVFTSTNGTFYHTWQWKEVLEDGLKTKSIPIVVEKEEKLLGIFSFFLINEFIDAKLEKRLNFISNKFRIIWSPHPKLYSFGGPCVPSEEKSIYNYIFNFTNNYAKKEKSVVDSWIYPFDNKLESILIENGYTKRRNRKSVIINLEKDLEEICKTFKKQYQKDIRRSIRNEVIVVESNNSLDDINLFYNKFQKILMDWIIEQTNNNYGMVSNAALPYSYFKAIHDVLFPEKLARLFFAEYRGEKVGALINFYYKDTIYLGHTSVLKGEYNSLNAYKLLIWKTIVDGKKKGFKKLDLTGLTPDITSGQYRFKLGFNGEILETGEYKKLYRYKKLRGLCKGRIL